MFGAEVWQFFKVVFSFKVYSYTALVVPISAGLPLGFGLSITTPNKECVLFRIPTESA